MLDCGTGSGYLAHLAAQLGHRVTGVDNSEGMLEAARSAGTGSNPTFVHGDVQNLALDGPFDAITSRYVLWTLPDPAGAVASWASRLRPGGIMLAFDANWFPNGAHADVDVESDDGADAFRSTYTPEYLSTLPLAQVTSPEPYVEIFRQAGL